MYFREFDRLLRKACGQYNIKFKPETEVSYVKTAGNLSVLRRLGVDTSFYDNPYVIALLKGDEVICHAVMESDTPRGFTPTVDLRQIITDNFIEFLLEALGENEVKQLGFVKKIENE